jgi:hypothetical protein
MAIYQFFKYCNFLPEFLGLRSHRSKKIILQFWSNSKCFAIPMFVTSLATFVSLLATGFNSVFFKAPQWRHFCTLLHCCPNLQYSMKQGIVFGDWKVLSPTVPIVSQRAEVL